MFCAFCLKKCIDGSVFWWGLYFCEVMFLSLKCEQASPGSKKIVGVFYKANEYAAMNPNFVGCVEGALGIRDWLESQGHQYIVTDDKEGPDSGQYIVR